MLYERAVKARRELDQAVDEISQMGGRMVGELHLGAVPLAVMLLIPETLRTFGQEFPEIRLRVSEELYVAQLQRLRAQEVDVTVGGIPGDLSTGEFFVEPLMKTSMVATVRAAAPGSVRAAWPICKTRAGSSPGRAMPRVMPSCFSNTTAWSRHVSVRW